MFQPILDIIVIVAQITVSLTSGELYKLSGAFICQNSNKPNIFPTLQYDKL